MKDAVDAGGHQLFLAITQITGDIFRHKHNAPLAVHNEKEAIQGLVEQEENKYRRQKLDVCCTKVPHSQTKEMDQAYMRTENKYRSTAIL